ncbi:DNA-directed RNA polymerase subunit beta-RNA polymerase subunit beta-Transcriptase subunit beta [Moritella viscosa]|nr:DNA-directed RNA polymerase subunit beta-RNA polymerase subunit beta-Transcriptase subunit beta [Moritella viscosa]SHO20236.1 DNA-directed RNA polymerase subunit beta-RNA polymerase subunit beta-Transcriptase subunit beta [Moritella viscosa]
MIKHSGNHQDFIERNYKRWEKGVDKLDVLYITAQEAAVDYVRHGNIKTVEGT